MKISVPKSGKGYNGTVIGGFGARQVAAFGIGIALIIVFNVLFSKHIGVMWATTLGIFPCLLVIILVCGTFNGLTAKQYFLRLYCRYKYDSDGRPFITKGGGDSES